MVLNWRGGGGGYTLRVYTGIQVKYFVVQNETDQVPQAGCTLCLNLAFVIYTFSNKNISSTLLYRESSNKFYYLDNLQEFYNHGLK